MRRYPLEVWTYFIKDLTSGLVKIGRCSGGVQKRLREIESCNPNGVTVIGAIPGNVEAEVHARFVRLRRYREWFLCTPDLIAFIESRCSSFTPAPDKTECCVVCRRKAVIGTQLCRTCFRPEVAA